MTLSLMLNLLQILAATHLWRKMYRSAVAPHRSSIYINTLISCFPFAAAATLYRWWNSVSVYENYNNNKILVLRLLFIQETHQQMRQANVNGDSPITA